MMIEAFLFAHLMYDHSCCDERHCRPVPCEQIAPLDDGWLFHGMKFSRTMLRDAPDGQCHVCVATGPLCIYLPLRVG